MTQKTPDNDLVVIDLFEKMSKLTGPRCGTEEKCRGRTRGNRCCDEFYCQIAASYALEEWGVELVPTGHSTLPFMGENGCTVAPHLRPLCTLHDCQINGIGCDFTDEKFTKEYFDLRGQIDLELYTRDQIKKTLAK